MRAIATNIRMATSCTAMNTSTERAIIMTMIMAIVIVITTEAYVRRKRHGCLMRLLQFT